MSLGKMAESKVPPPAQGIEGFLSEVINSPIDLALVAVISVLIYKIYKSRTRQNEPVPVYKQLPKLRRDFTIEELREYDGTKPDGRILVALNGKVFDVTRGSTFYGPGMCRPSA